MYVQFSIRLSKNSWRGDCLSRDLSGRRDGRVLPSYYRLVNQNHMARELVLDAIRMAVRRRNPTHTLIHSDQGSQFGSDAWRRFCHAHHLEPSMSRRGNCWDNAVAESFLSSLKKELIKKRIYTTRNIATAEIYEYIELFYNRTRRHSHLSGVSPEAFEAVSKRA